ncbi:hypothetical protein [Meridianimarinicoccus aquatilis]|nr:hypothetical protein [Fluviibacterium aquatile]
MLIRAATVLAFLLAQTAAAQMYTDADRARVMARAAPNLQSVLQDDIIGNLPRAQRPDAAGIRMVFPPHGPSPLAFYADPRSQTIYFPQDSIRFLDDIATLFAWFQSKECEPGMIQTYLWALLRDRQNLASPLRAFHIDRDIALADEFTNNVSAKIYSSALQFILAHEVGHILLQHRGGLQGAASQSQEIAADRFALDHFARLGAMPLGISFYYVAAWWQDPLGAAVADSSHPVSPDRIAAIADGFAANPMDFAHSEPDPAQGAIMVESVAKDLANIAQLAASDGMLSLLPMGLERDFPVSRFATACPTP